MLCGLLALCYDISRMKFFKKYRDKGCLWYLLQTWSILWTFASITLLFHIFSLIILIFVSYALSFKYLGFSFSDHLREMLGPSFYEILKKPFTLTLGLRLGVIMGSYIFIVWYDATRLQGGSFVNILKKRYKYWLFKPSTCIKTFLSRRVLRKRT